MGFHRRFMTVMTAAFACGSVHLLAQTTQEKESVEALEVDKAKEVIEMSHAKSAAQAFRLYRTIRDQTFKDVMVHMRKPPKDKARAKVEINNLLIKVNTDLDEIAKMTKGSGGDTAVHEISHLVNKEKERWTIFGELAERAIEIRTQMVLARILLKDAAEDTPKKAKAIVDELEVVETNLEEASSDSDAQAQKRRAQFISTVVTNVQHARETIVESAQELKDKKEFKPATVDSQINPIKTKLDAIAQDTNQERPFADTSRELSELLKKTQTEYKSDYQKAMDALEPVITGKAANEVSTFKDVKPSELLSRAMKALADRQ